MIAKIEKLEADFKQEKLDHDREKVFNRNGQVEKEHMEHEIHQMKTARVRAETTAWSCSH
jgi:cell division septum initiation protein DivIVA